MPQVPARNAGKVPGWQGHNLFDHIKKLVAHAGADHCNIWTARYLSRSKGLAEFFPVKNCAGVLAVPGCKIFQPGCQQLPAAGRLTVRQIHGVQEVCGACVPDNVSSAGYCVAAVHQEKVFYISGNGGFNNGFPEAAEIWAPKNICLGKRFSHGVHQFWLASQSLDKLNGSVFAFVMDGIFRILHIVFLRRYCTASDHFSADVAIYQLISPQILHCIN